MKQKSHRTYICSHGYYLSHLLLVLKETVARVRAIRWHFNPVPCVERVKSTWDHHGYRQSKKESERGRG